jgi:hypothetical protein
MGPRSLSWVCFVCFGCLYGPLPAFADDGDIAPVKDAGKPPAKDAGKPGGKESAKAAPKKAGGCVEVSGEASFASVGYDHIVTLTSGCKKRMTCSVKTNVNPEPASVQLEPGESQSVVTWRGSPAREFTPDVTCAPSKG